MKKTLVSILLEFIFTILFWVALIAAAILWPFVYLYLRLVSKTPVSDQVSELANAIIKVNDFLDAIVENMK